MTKYFDSEGKAIDLDALFDDDGYPHMDAYMEAIAHMRKGGTSDAVRLYWAVEMANETHGNYKPETLFRRS